MASGPITSWQIEKQWKQWQTLFSWTPKSLQVVTAAMSLQHESWFSYSHNWKFILCHDLRFLNVEFEARFFTFLFHLHQEVLCSSSLSAISVVSSVYLRLLIFLLAILILVCASSSPAVCMMYSAYKLSKQSDDIQPWCTPFPILNQFIFQRPVLTVATRPASTFLRRRVRGTRIPISLRIIKKLSQYVHLTSGPDM